MNLQVSVIGIGIIALYSAMVVLVIARPLSRWLRDRRWKWAVVGPIVLPLLAAPWAEEAWIAWHFDQACKEAGVHVYRTVEVEGYLNATGSSVSSSGAPVGVLEKEQGDFEKQGYRFVEHRLADGKIWHLERSGDRLRAEILDRPQARYHYKRAYQPTPHKYEEPVAWKVQKVETQVVDSQSGEILGRDARFHRYPSVMEGLWIRLLGSGQITCEGTAPKPPDLRYLLYHYILIPKKPS